MLELDELRCGGSTGGGAKESQWSAKSNRSKQMDTTRWVRMGVGQLAGGQRVDMDRSHSHKLTNPPVKPSPLTQVGIEITTVRLCSSPFINLVRFVLLLSNI